MDLFLKKLNQRQSVLEMDKREINEHLILDRIKKVHRTIRYNQSRLEDENFPVFCASLLIDGFWFFKSILALIIVTLFMQRR